MQGRKHYQEKLFTVFRLSDRVPPDNFYRRLKESLDFGFLYEATAKYYGREGNPGLDPVVFFKLLLTGYFENLPSDRRIIENARLRMDVLYFIGYGIDEELPWHSTLSRTRKLLGEEVFQKLFRAVLKQCVDKGMVSGRSQAVDSVLVKANASLESFHEKDVFEQAAEYLAGLGEDEAAVLPLPGKEKKKPANEARRSSTDPDARLASKPGKPQNLCYLGQVSVDASHHVITSIEAHLSDRRDSECLEDVLGGAMDNLALNGLEVKEVMADANYSSASALKALEAKGIEAWIPNLGGYKPAREGFKYVEDGDYYECERGVKLTFRRMKENRGNGQMKHYASRKSDCKGCPLLKECAGKSGVKTIAHTTDRTLFERMHEKMDTARGRRMQRLRSSTVEPVIGTLAGFLAMKRTPARGIRQANKHMIGAAIAYNLKKWMRWMRGKKPAVAIAMPKPEKIVVKMGMEPVFHAFSRQESSYSPM